MFVCTDACVYVDFLREETGVHVAFRFQCLIYLESLQCNGPLTAPFKGKYIAIVYRYFGFI